MDFMYSCSIYNAKLEGHFTPHIEMNLNLVQISVAKVTLESQMSIRWLVSLSIC